MNLIRLTQHGIEDSMGNILLTLSQMDELGWLWSATNTAIELYNTAMRSGSTKDYNRFTDFLLNSEEITGEMMEALIESTSVIAEGKRGIIVDHDNVSDKLYPIRMCKTLWKMKEKALELGMSVTTEYNDDRKLIQIFIQEHERGEDIFIASLLDSETEKEKLVDQVISKIHSELNKPVGQGTIDITNLTNLLEELPTDSLINYLNQ